MDLNTKMNYPGKKDKTFSNLNNVLELLQWQATHNPDNIAFSFLDDEFTITSVSYDELCRKALLVATSLQTFITPGERILLLYPPGIDFLIALFGCLFAGGLAIPFILPVSVDIEHNLLFLENQINDSDPSLILTNDSILSHADLIFYHLKNHLCLQWFATDTETIVSNFGWKKPVIGGNEPIMLLYPYRSTFGTPGLRISHNYIISKTRLLNRFYNVEQKQISLSWIATDWGIIESVFFPLYKGITNIIISLETLEKNPGSWLKAISQFQVNISGGPGYLYDLCSKCLSPEDTANLDLNNWDVAYINFEIANYETINAFTEKFESHGFRKKSFYPRYLIPEANLVLTGKRFGEEYAFIDLDIINLGKGNIRILDDDTDVSIKIGAIDENNEEINFHILDPEKNIIVKEDELGEIGLSGYDLEIIKYYDQKTIIQKPEEEFFLTGDKYLRSGYIGFKHNGGIYLIERTENVIFLGEKIIFISHIENEILYCDPRIKPGGVHFLVCDQSSKIKIVVACELIKINNAKFVYSLEDYREITRRIRHKVQINFELALNEIILLDTDNFPKAIKRIDTRKAFQDAYNAGSLEARYSEK